MGHKLLKKHLNLANLVIIYNFVNFWDVRGTHKCIKRATWGPRLLWGFYQIIDSICFFQLIVWLTTKLSSKEIFVSSDPELKHPIVKWSRKFKSFFFFLKTFSSRFVRFKSWGIKKWNFFWVKIISFYYHYFSGIAKSQGEIKSHIKSYVKNGDFVFQYLMLF